MVFGSVCHSEQTTAPADDDADEGGGEHDDDGAGAERQIRVVGLGHQRSHRTVHLLSGNVGIMNEAKSVAGNHWLRLSPSVDLLRGQVWSN